MLRSLKKMNTLYQQLTASSKAGMEVVRTALKGLYRQKAGNCKGLRLMSWELQGNLIVMRHAILHALRCCCTITLS